MSRVEAGTFELDVGPVDLHDVVERVRDTAAPTMAKSDLTLVIDLGPELTLTGDCEQLERALLNLISNSVKSTKAGGRIEIATRTAGDDIAFPCATPDRGSRSTSRPISLRGSSALTGRRSNRCRGTDSACTS